ncbi:hypothetical protein K9U40_17645 [Xanthobacter autotrophicus]|uniref:hypothetical protein n=1 Tax=Xanthobacter TaxID=279 RepID=UPI0024AA2CC2|nr:hypothetical protein [Xanthobacter autotrophicus]MDI4666132.1 hypothetical protein [Xanthobacter autotrophicus]
MGDLALGFDDGKCVNWGFVGLGRNGDRSNRSNYGDQYDAETSAARRWPGVA